MRVYVLIDGTVRGQGHIRVFETKEDLISAFIEMIQTGDWPKTYRDNLVVSLQKDTELKSRDTQTEMLRAFDELPYDAGRINMKDFLFHYCPDVQYETSTLEWSTPHKKRKV